MASGDFPIDTWRTYLVNGNSVTTPIPIPSALTVPNVPGVPVQFIPYPRPTLSDFDIELMAVCIANKHPQMEDSNGCFCAMKRLEKGISKD